MQEVLNRIRPRRPEWYEELYAFALDKLTKPYEAEVRDLIGKMCSRFMLFFKIEFYPYLELFLYMVRLQIISHNFFLT